MRGVADELEEAGFKITSRWLESPRPLTAIEFEPGGVGGDLASMDLDDLRRSQMCLAFTEEAAVGPAGRGGRHTELGIALGLGLKVILVGPREHIFHALPGIDHLPDWPEARRTLIPRKGRVAELVAS